MTILIDLGFIKKISSLYKEVEAILNDRKYSDLIDKYQEDYLETGWKTFFVSAKILTSITFTLSFLFAPIKDPRVYFLYLGRP